MHFLALLLVCLLIVQLLVDEIIQFQCIGIHQLLIFWQRKNYNLKVDLLQLIEALQ